MRMAESLQGIVRAAKETQDFVAALQEQIDGSAESEASGGCADRFRCLG